MLIEELTKILEISWSKDTCTPSLQDSWNENNKALGQCAITALIVNDFLGGKIMRCMSETGSHYYNIINDHIIDLTSSQFEKAPKYIEAEKRTRDYLLSNEDTKKRYLLLLKEVKNNFMQYGMKEYKLLGINGDYFSKIPATCGGNKNLKVYGKMNCPSTLYLDGNDSVYFENPEIANKLGYRPCSVCMKKEFQKWEQSKQNKQ